VLNLEVAPPTFDWDFAFNFIIFICQLYFYSRWYLEDGPLPEGHPT
jgi:hypothetical protein